MEHPIRLIYTSTARIKFYNFHSLMFASKYYDWSLNYKILEGWILLVVSEGPLEIGTVDAFEVSELFSQQLQWCSIWYKYRNGDCGIISWRLNLMDMGGQRTLAREARERRKWMVYFFLSRWDSESDSELGSAPYRKGKLANMLNNRIDLSSS